MKATKVAMGAIWYIVLRCDEVYITNNQAWLSICCHVVHNQVRILIFIFLECVLEGSRNDNPTKVIMKALMFGGRLPKYHITLVLITWKCLWNLNVHMLFNLLKFCLHMWIYERKINHPKLYNLGQINGDSKRIIWLFAWKIPCPILE
jgi:hypothetical protein